MEQLFLKFTELASVMDFVYLDQLLAALLPMGVTVFLHAQGVSVTGRCIRRFAPSTGGAERQQPHILLLIAIVGILLVTHFLEVVAWALFYNLTGLLPDARQAMDFSMNTYTTLGSSALALPGRWVGFEGFEALTAMLMFGWSTALLATVVLRLHTIDD
ncbi:MAG: hypothetical protein R3E50_02885 [Halioglobus sp.]